MGRVKDNKKGKLVPTRMQPSRAVKRKTSISEVDKNHPEKRVKLNAAANNFQCLIAERMAEVKLGKAERIKLELGVIEDIKLGNEQDCLLEVFPEEIWIHILSSVENPMDLANLWKVNPLFRDLLAKLWIPQILLPQLVNILLSNNQSHFEPSKYPASTFRMISKPLRNAVDKWYEDNLLFCLQGGEGHVPSYSVIFCKDEEKLDKTLTLFCSGSEVFRAKRFFLRSLVITVKNWSRELSQRRNLVEHFAEFKTKILALLKVIGAQIWHFAFKFFDLYTFAWNGMRLVKVCESIQQFAALMPNLKWLEIQFGHSPALNLTKVMCADSRSDPKIGDLQFPYLPNLEKVDFRVSDKNCIRKFMLLEQILDANSHIKILEVETIADEEDTRRNIYESLFESINYHSVKLNGFHLRSSTELEVLQPLAQMNHGIQSLHFAFNSNLHGSLETAFNFVNKFPALETLFIHVENLHLGGAIPPLDVPNLTSFKITIVEQNINYATPGSVYFFYSLHFLLESKKLTGLTWDNRSSEPNDELHRFLVNYEDQGDMINFRGGYGDLKNCKIWRVFPELERVKVNIWIITKNLKKSSKTDEQENLSFIQKEYRRSEVVQFRWDEFVQAIKK